MRRRGVYKHLARTLVLIFSVLLSHFAAAQIARSRTTVCDIAAHPRRYSGRIVTIRAKVLSGFEIFAIQDPSGKCEQMWLKYAGGSPTAISAEDQVSPRPLARLKLKRDAEFNKFTEMLKAKMYPRNRGTVCMGCNRYMVTATMTGRITAGRGFGHLGAYALQFELQSVKDVVGKDLASNYDSSVSPTPVRFPTGYFKGVVRSPSGEAVKGIEVTARTTEEVPFYMQQVSNRTNDEGRFELDVPPGSYVVGVNIAVPVVAKYPFPPTYFPSATERTAATVLNVQDGQTIDTDVTIPRMAVRSDVTLHVEWPDGKPAGRVLVWLKETETRTTYGIAETGLLPHTDEQGVMTIAAFEGFAYTAYAETNVLHPNSYEHFCAQPVRIDPSGTGRDVVLTLSIKGEDVCGDLNP